MQFVMIEWVDAFGCTPDWRELSEADDWEPAPILCRSVGWLCHDGKECKVVVPHVADSPGDDPKQGCGEMTIPTVAIRAIRNVSISETPYESPQCHSAPSGALGDGREHCGP